MRTASAPREVHIGKVIQEAVRQRSVERKSPCATPERLVLFKLYALPSLYRQGNFTRVTLCENDILILMHQHGIDLEPLLEELKGCLSPADLEELRKITDEIRQRIARFGQEFQ